MSGLFTDVLINRNSSNLKQKKSAASRTSVSPGTMVKKCPTDTAASSNSAGVNISVSQKLSLNTPTPFLKQMLLNEKAAVESLLKVAAKIGPIANTLVEKEAAYDAAFESEVPAAVPTYTSTIQGFTLILFFVSFIAAIFIITVYVNMVTGNAATAGTTFVGLVILFAVIIALIKRFG